MTRCLKIVGLTALLTVSSISLAGAQDKPAAPARAVVPLKVQLVIARYQGEKRLSSVPYALSVTASEGRTELARLRIGTQVPIPAPPPAPPADGKPAPPSASFTYRDIGTNIDCNAQTVGDGQFQLQITVEQASVFKEDQPAPGALNAPVFRSFRLTNTVVLKDGQTTQFATATDALNGEVVRVDVTVNVAK